jgi:nodulation protein E
MPRRVAVTGVGVVCAIGLNISEFWDSLREGRSGIGPIRSLPPGTVRFPNGAEIPSFQSEKYFDLKDVAFLDRFAQYGVIAARQAIEDAGIEWTPELKRSAAIITGSCLGGKETEDDGYYQLYGQKNTRFNPLTIPRAMGNAAASRISLEFGLTGPVYTISTACSSSNHALGNAFWLVRNGQVDIAITGGSEAVFTRGVLHAWEAMRVVSPDTCRPFSKDRRGLILGDGGAMLVLEGLDGARARGARIYAEVVGFGMSSDAHHVTQPSADGASRAMRAALADGDLTPEHIGYINAHGTGTPANDSTETSAIRAVFGSHADRLLVSSTKSLHGHTLGAAGAVEGVAAILALQNGLIPPTANYTEPDPACDLDIVPNHAKEAHIEYALSNSFAFGGLNAVIAFRRV